jgi:hypothetical protein
MAAQPPANPYNPRPADGEPAAPFAGRQKAFEALYQALTGPAQTDTTLIMGRAGSGKTALLRHFNTFFDETFVGVYLPLRAMSLSDENTWLQTFIDATGRMLAESGYTLSRLPELEGETANLREWFTGTYLPDVLNILRRHRRLIYLLDDAEKLLGAIQSSAIPPDTLSYLDSLKNQFSTLGFVLTLDTRHESQIAEWSPLVELESVFRLSKLDSEATTWLLNEPVAGQYRLTDDAAQAVHRSTGGEPRLLQRFGFHLFNLWEKTGKPTLNGDDLKPVTARVYNESEAELRAAWGETTRNERLVLTAISSLLYADPLGTVTPANVETWLVETDYPLDSTTINAAVRGLEYREIIENTPSGIHITAGLMQSWLLENARLTENTSDRAPRPRLQWVVLAIVALIVIALVLVASQGSAPTASADAPQPTVTLLPNP